MSEYYVQDIWGFWATCPVHVYNTLVDIFDIPANHLPAYEQINFAAIEIAPGVHTLYDPRSFTEAFAQLKGGAVASLTIIPQLMGVNCHLIVFPLSRDYDMLSEHKRDILARDARRADAAEQVKTDECEMSKTQLVGQESSRLVDKAVPLTAIHSLTGVISTSCSPRRRRRAKKTSVVVESQVTALSSERSVEAEVSEKGQEPRCKTGVTTDKADGGGWTVYYSRRYKQKEKLWFRLSSFHPEKKYEKERPLHVSPRPLRVDFDDDLIPGRKFFKWRTFHEQRIKHD